MNSDQYDTAFIKLETWIDNNGLAGYDPYDLKGMNWMVTLIKWGNRSFFFEVVREVIIEFFLMFPLFFRRLFFIKKKVNPKAVGLLASSYLDQYILTKENRYLLKTQELLKWLDTHAVVLNEGIGWGYPFDWQSAQLIPANTPNGIVTTAVAEVYWNMYEHTHDQHYLNQCKRIASFLNSLPKDYRGEDQLCFSYTPLYINHVHNLNLFVAEFIMKIGIHCNIEQYRTNAQRAINYTIDAQLADGSFDYNGPPEPPQNIVDHYHTGFNMRMLYSIWKMTSDDKVKVSLDKCYDHYINNFFDGPKPKFTPTRLYRLDIHSVSECIHCLYSLGKHYPQGKAVAEKTLSWAIDELQDRDGWFYHGIFKSRIYRRPFKSKVPYMRWAQAWMYRAMTTRTLTLQQNTTQ